MHDVAYLMTSSMSAQERIQNEEMLIRDANCSARNSFVPIVGYGGHGGQTPQILIYLSFYQVRSQPYTEGDEGGIFRWYQRKPFGYDCLITVTNFVLYGSKSGMCNVGIIDLHALTFALVAAAFVGQCGTSCTSSL